MNLSECTFGGGVSRERIEEWCCLYALGELKPEEMRRIQSHLRTCKSCNELVGGFERIMLFDLPAVAVMHSEGSIPDEPSAVDAGKLLERVRERARSGAEEENGPTEWTQTADPAPLGSRKVSFLPSRATAAWAAGWIIAAGLFLHYVPVRFTVAPGAGREGQRVIQQKPDFAAQTANLLQQLEKADAAEATLRDELARTSARGRIARSDLARLKARYRDLNSLNAELDAQMKEREELLGEASARLQLTRDTLSSAIAAKSALERQLSDVYGRLDKEDQEVARLSRASAAAPAVYPISEKKVSEGEATAILGARDLHIVDVYDVDDSSHAQHAYGRIYYINHRLLVFYAFDLSRLEKKHKLVAFQAWGFRQPRDSNVESLGLFYLDNARLNRWALRVSNPEILARIDTLFVTMEPPGGSRFPKGRRLLMASLAGPPNHP